MLASLEFALEYRASPRQRYQTAGGQFETEYPMRCKPNSRWHLDEMVVRINDRQKYLWLAVDDV